MKRVPTTKKKYEPKVKLLQCDFADMKAGQTMAIGSPELISQIVKTIPKGSDWNLSDLRKSLAKRLGAKVACPVTTSMYLRKAIEDEVASGRKRFRFPFWRVVSCTSTIFGKLTENSRNVILSQRLREGLE